MPQNIIISNQKNFNSKLYQLQTSGLQSLSIISDFDRTLTSAKGKNGEKSHTSFGLIRDTGHLPELAITQLKEYFLKYWPSERDPNLDKETKLKLMTEWWSKVFEVYIQQAIEKKLIHKIVEEHALNMRDGYLELMNKLKSDQVPLLIFSAGIGEVISHYLNHNNLNSDNVGLVSNFFVYDQQDRITGYQKPIIHALNKTEATAKKTPHYKKATARKNIILLGDSFHDPHMAQDENHDCVLRIGFLNSKEDQFLDMYRQLYDVVILKDQGLGYVIRLIDSLE